MKKILLALALASPLFAAPVYAKVVYGTAEKSVKVAELPSEDIALPDGRKVSVGYCYKQFHIFWLPLWNWDEKYCGYVDEDTYTTAGYEELVGISKLMGFDTSWDDGKSKIPMWERVGGKVVGGAILLFFLLYGIIRRRG